MNNNNPLNEEFYATVKLVSGEELFSKVCAFDEDGAILLVLDHPVFVETVYVPKLDAPIAKVNPWISLTNETTFIIGLDKVITITEIYDDMYINMHKRYIRDKERKNNKTKPTPNMGYVASVTEAREMLEKLYNSEPSNGLCE